MARTHVTGQPDWSLPSVYENIAGGEVYPHEFLVENSRTTECAMWIKSSV